MIVFACWAWRDSYFLNRFTNKSGYGIAHMNGGIAIARITHYLGTGSGSAPPSKSVATGDISTTSIHPQR